MEPQAEAPEHDGEAPPQGQVLEVVGATAAQGNDARQPAQHEADPLRIVEATTLESCDQESSHGGLADTERTIEQDDHRHVALVVDGVTRPPGEDVLRRPSS